MNSWLTALVLGLAGSLHCVGMCSPLVLAATARKPFLLSKIIYNSGRILIYGIMGTFAALAGSTIVLDSQQKYFSVALGILMMLVGIGVLTKMQIPFWGKIINGFIIRLKSFFGIWLHSKHKIAVFILGMLNGLLPCGLTYVAVAYCFVMPSAMDGFWFMLFFGIGTWPVMIGLTWAIGLSTITKRFRYQNATAVIFFLVGTLLIGRGFLPDHLGHSSPLGIARQEPGTVCK
jgi:uncharacterized protein